MTKASSSRRARKAPEVLARKINKKHNVKVPPDVNIQAAQEAMNSSVFRHIDRHLPNVQLDKVEVSVDAKSDALFIRCFKGNKRITLIEPSAARFPSQEFLAKLVLFAQD